MFPSNISELSVPCPLENLQQPSTFTLITIILVGGLSLINGTRVYKKLFVNIVETGLYFNLLVLAAFNSYDFKGDVNRQRAVAYSSTIILLVGVIIYHVSLLVRKDRLPEEVNEYPMAPVQPKDKAEVTHSVIELPKPRDQSPPPQANIDEVEIKVLTATPMYQ